MTPFVKVSVQTGRARNVGVLNALSKLGALTVTQRKTGEQDKPTYLTLHLQTSPKLTDRSIHSTIHATT